ncbi:ribosomal protein L32 [Pneumocystis murina B123]|uniref:Large ribosomal subunit protein bL32m n=1 Tax=Pneumocystis murina (strain B123) TaxID=1069680 RepID=M7NLM1_PNEMU|nr:ribosomal protein L32 [Pneumocystis murina B123]EMR09563.1 ribosomal protein L32 [Pneumocystis murina B123]
MFGVFLGLIIEKYVQPTIISWIPTFISTGKYSALIPMKYGYGMSFESILWAAPKKKTSYSKKRMRQATKGLRDIQHLNYCSACGKKKLAHTLCLFCYKEIKEFIKSKYK